MKKLLVLLLLVVATTAAVAETQVPWVASYNKPGNMNAYASVGWAWYPEVGAAIEFMVGEFDIATIPFDWGIMARAGFEFWGTGFDYGVGALATLHMGLQWNLDFYAGIGAAYYGPTAAFPIGFASYGGMAWWFSKNVGLLLENGYLGWTYLWGVGLAFKL